MYGHTALQRNCWQSSAREVLRFLVRTHTLGEEGRDGKAEHDGSNGVEEQENKGDGEVGVVDEGSFAHVQVEEEGHDGNADSQKKEVLEEPGHPVEPRTQTHQLHGLLLTHTHT